MMRLKKHDLLAPHTPPNLPEVKSNFRDPDDPPHWIGMQAWAAAVCFNTAEAARLGLPKPTSWYDLLDSRFRGRITMPDPSSRTRRGFPASSAARANATTTTTCPQLGGLPNIRRTTSSASASKQRPWLSKIRCGCHECIFPMADFAFPRWNISGSRMPKNIWP